MNDGESQPQEQVQQTSSATSAVETPLSSPLRPMSLEERRALPKYGTDYSFGGKY